MPTTKYVPVFKPSKNGFLFADNAWPQGTTFNVQLPSPLGSMSFDAHNGICDGLAFTVLDLFLHQPLFPPPPDTSAPAPASALFQYLTAREADAFLSGHASNILKALDWIRTPSHNTVFGDIAGQRGLSWRTINDEWPDIRKDIGVLHTPSPVWLVVTPECPPTNIPRTQEALQHHHLVLVYGYQLDVLDKLTLYIYDPQQPGKDNCTITCHMSHPEHTIAFDVPSVTWGQVRGFFRAYYERHDPWPIVSAALTGTVISSTTRQPIAHARMLARGGSPGGASSGADGRYAMGGLKPGPYDLSATAQGHVEQRVGINLGAWTRQVHDFALAPDPDAGIGSVAGVVTEVLPHPGKPIAQATVSLANAWTANSTKTDATGHYRFQAVACGPCEVSATKSGYQACKEKAVVTSNATTTVDFSLEKPEPDRPSETSPP